MLDPFWEEFMICQEKYVHLFNFLDFYLYLNVGIDSPACDDMFFF